MKNAQSPQWFNCFNFKGFSLLTLFLILCLVSIGIPFIHRNRQQFDSAMWQANRYNASPGNPRSQMLGDLQRHYLKVGMTKAQVRSLLGTPDKTISSVDLYEVGYIGWNSLDPAMLELQYNNEVLFSIRVLED